MNTVLKNLYDSKGKIVAQMEDVYRNVNTRPDKAATEDERRQFTAWDSELVKLQEQIDFQKRGEQIELAKQAEQGVKLESEANKEKKFNETASKAERRSAFDKSLKIGYTSLSDEERSIVDTIQRDENVYNIWMRHGFDALNAEQRRVLSSMKEQRVQSVGTTTAGGYTVPEGFANRIIEKMKYISALLNWANILSTDTGATIPFPINDDTSNTGELIGENADLSSSTADLVFSVYNLSAYKFSSKMIKVSSELLQDNGVNLEAYLAKKLAERVARITNSYFTTGTGSSQPQGCMIGSTRGTVTASTSTWTVAEMIAFQDSLDIAYQNSPKTAWAMHQNILSELKQVSIGTNYNSQLWVPSFRDGAPDTILGKPYFVNQAMSSTSATGDKIMAYGDWNNFTIRRVNDFSLRRLTERYAEFDQVAFFGLARMDSFVEDSTAIKYLEIS